jgi:hypothetical protein
VVLLLVLRDVVVGRAAHGELGVLERARDGDRGWRRRAGVAEARSRTETEGGRGQRGEGGGYSHDEQKAPTAMDERGVLEPKAGY